MKEEEEEEIVKEVMRKRDTHTKEKSAGNKQKC